MHAVTQLLDRLAAADEAQFIVTWTEQMLSGRARTDPALAVRLLRAYRETGRVDRARELAASLPSSPVLVEPARRRAPRDRARHPRDHRRSRRSRRGRAPSGVARARGRAARARACASSSTCTSRSAQLELKLNRVSSRRRRRCASPSTSPSASRTARGASPSSMTLGHLAMRLADPRTAAKHYGAALARAPPRAASPAMSAHGNLAIALGSHRALRRGARHTRRPPSASQREIAAGWRHADAYDVLAIVEIAPTVPLAALQAHRRGARRRSASSSSRCCATSSPSTARWALAMLGRAQAAKQWLGQDRQAARGPRGGRRDRRAGPRRHARAHARGLRPAHGGARRGAAARRAPPGGVRHRLAEPRRRRAARSSLGDEATARVAVERAALSGDRHGWVFPDRQQSAGALAAGAARAATAASCATPRRMIAVLTNGVAPPSMPPPSARGASIPPPRGSFPSIPPPSRGSFPASRRGHRLRRRRLVRADMLPRARRSST